MSTKYLTKNKFLAWIAIIVWAAVSFYGSQLLLSGAIIGLDKLGVQFVLSSKVVSALLISVLVYVMTILALIFGPKLLFKIKTTKAELGLSRLPIYKDFLYLLIAILVYMPLTIIGSLLAQFLIPGFNASQTQDIGFTSLSGSVERAAGFLLLVVLAPFVEELIFRGWLYGKLQKYKIPAVILVITVSVLFGLAHGQWNVAVDVTILSIIMCWLRYASGSIWSGVMLHMLKNGVAFYFLFINTTLINSIGG